MKLNHLLIKVLILTSMFISSGCGARELDIQSRVYVSKNCLLTYKPQIMPQDTSLFALFAPIITGLIIDGVAKGIEEASKEKSISKISRMNFYLLKTDPGFDSLHYNENFNCITVVTGIFDLNTIDSRVLKPNYENWDSLSNDQKLKTLGIIDDSNKTKIYSIYEGKIDFSDDLTAVVLSSQLLEVRKLFSAKRASHKRGLVYTFDLQGPGGKSLMLGSLEFGDIKAGLKINSDSFKKGKIKGVRTNLMTIPGPNNQVAQAFKDVRVIRQNSPIPPTSFHDCGGAKTSGLPVLESAANTGCFSPVTLVVRHTEIKNANKAGLFVAKLLGATKQSLVSKVSKALETPDAATINASIQTLLDAKVAQAKANLAIAISMGVQADIADMQNALNEALKAAADFRVRTAQGGVDLVMPTDTFAPQNTSSTVLEFNLLNKDFHKAVAGERLIGGRVIDADEWPASLYTGVQGGFCTGTLVGPKVLLTAAHCVKNNPSVVINFNNKKIDGNCTTHKDYSESGPSQSLDYALCLLTSDITVSTYETINLESEPINMGNWVLLSGYGCIRKGGGGADGLYRVGYSKITSNPLSEISDYNDFIHSIGNTALCSGDSGGPAFTIPYPGIESIRSIIGVNSKGNLQKWSLLASTNRQEAQDFINTWIKQNNNPDICGINKSDNPCRKIK